MCENTNKNAEEKPADREKVTLDGNRGNGNEIPGILLCMPVVRLPKIRDFWRTIFHVPFPATIMVRDRFEANLSNVQISNPAEDQINEEKKEEGH